MSRWFAGVALLVLVGCRRTSADQAFRPLRIGDPAPRYSVRTLAGDSIHIRPGEPLTLVNIWATWCIPCRKEFPDLANLHRDYRDRGLRVVAVSVDQGGDGEVRSFLATRDVGFTIGRDAEREIERRFLTVGVPESFLIGTDGRLLWKKIGALAPGALDVRAAIDSVLLRVPRRSPPTGT